ncbi:MAG: GIY-YIG nuclease family protein [Alphaproteobacteria bacterium]|nr:GIY-YIG nuclease family protein [Alphaproteobacteria bacterium]
MKQPSYVYILASGRHGTLYIGVTTDLVQRVSEHKAKAAKGFTAKYNVDQLVYYEVYDDIISAINREKNMKAWKREWKINHIIKDNPEWRDLFYEITQ